MLNDNGENNLDIFFKMIDSVEDNISAILEDKSNELGGYECLVICFNWLRFYCGQVGIKFSQIEDHYNAFKESKVDGTFWNFKTGLNPADDEVEGFSRVLEEIENCLSVFEQRCNKTEELFDEWNCVFIMYSCLRKYGDEIKTNYTELMSDILKIESDCTKNGDTNPESMNSLS